MSSEIIQKKFHKISFHYFEDYLMTKLTLGYGSFQHLEFIFSWKFVSQF